MDIRSLILAQNDLPVETVSIPEWKDADGKPLSIRVKAMSAGERDSYEKEQLANMKNGKVNIRASLAARAVVDEQGNRMFTDADVEALGNKNGVALNRIFEAVLKLNNVDVAELEKNS